MEHLEYFPPQMAAFLVFEGTLRIDDALVSAFGVTLRIQHWQRSEKRLDQLLLVKILSVLWMEKTKTFCQQKERERNERKMPLGDSWLWCEIGLFFIYTLAVNYFCFKFNIFWYTDTNRKHRQRHKHTQIHTNTQTHTNTHRHKQYTVYCTPAENIFWCTSISRLCHCQRVSQS